MDLITLDREVDLFALHAADPHNWPYLLESRQPDPRIGRYSLLLGEPRQRVSCHRPEELDKLFARLPQILTIQPDTTDTQPPFMGGWFLYLSYDAALGMQPHLQPPAAFPPAGEAPPLALAVYCGAAIMVDHVARQSWIVSESGQARVHRAQLEKIKPPAFAPLHLRFASDAPDAFLEAVQQAVAYIHAGDIYQANLSRCWSAGAMPAEKMLAAYSRLREANPACFAASIQDRDLRLASASPERLFLLDRDRIETRPIAGTRPRGSSPEQDQALIEELLRHPKEQAEHIMLVDLERNDLGRICQAASVEVSEFLALESYATVHHIVSNVRGRLRGDVSLRELLEAVFPGGTITGCPKIHCMQLISMLEKRLRGAYTGSLGYISNSGRMDFNILIRTLAHERGAVGFAAGAGIVADSVPRRELAETEAKAAGLMRALA